MRRGIMLGLLLAGAAWAFQSAPATGSIEGQVLNAATGAPLRKATVRMVAVSQRQGAARGARGQEVDERGMFSFAGLEPGKYLLTAERTRFLRQAYGGRKYNTSGIPIVVGPDQHVKDITFKLSPQSVITGRVLDEDGEGIANVQVRALRYQYREGKKQWSTAGAGRTSDIGEYRIPSLQPGKYLVTVVSLTAENRMDLSLDEPLPSKPESIYGATYYPSTPDQANAVPVDVPAGGEVHGIDVRMRKVQVFRVRGAVAGASGGRNVVPVMLWAKGRTPEQPITARAVGPDYRFEFRGVTPGSYLARAIVSSGRQRMEAVGTVEVAGSNVEGLVLSAAQAGNLTGLVRLEDGSAPAGRLSLQLRDVDSFEGTPRGRVGDDGHFTVGNVMPGHYTVSVSGVPDNCFVKSIRYGGQEVPADGLDMAPAGTLEVTLSATAGAVTASAVDSDGRPDAGAVIVLLPETGAGSSRNADETGVAAFHGLKPGAYRAIAFEDIPPGAWQDPDFLKPYESRAVDVKVEPNGSQTVQVKAVPAEETDR